MISSNPCHGAWDCAVKISKFFLWVGGMAASIGGLGYGFGFISEENKNKLIKNFGIKVI